MPIVRSTKGASDRSSSPPLETTLGMGLGRGAAFTNVANDDKTSDNWRDEISEQNERVVASMTDEERRAQRREITERFGPDIGDVLRRVREQRLRQLQQQQQPPPPRKRNIDGEFISFVLILRQFLTFYPHISQFIRLCRSFW